jgi:phosphopantothenoylcysteine decarboxylase/phosphopantothenate--cysteine ligase
VNIVLGVSGGIAAYKTPELVRRLRDIGADVRVILTPNASRFVSPLSLSAVSGHGVVVEQWGDASQGGVDHIEIARWSDLLLIAPATANILAKLAVGIADDALSTYAIAHRTDIMVAPAMNTFMFSHPTVTQNIATLRNRGVRILDPDSGSLACGDEGVGRMPDVPVIVEQVKLLFRDKDLTGRRILVTAGPTREPVDPVRYLTNRSSGRMGYALADAAARRGAHVTLISGPTALPMPHGVDVHHVLTAQEMHDEVMAHLDSNEIIIKAAAVADFTPSDPASQKIKKGEASDAFKIRLRKTPDILESIAKHRPKPFVVAFAAETQHVEQHAREKLKKKEADLIVANDVSDASIGFDSEHNEVLVIGRDGNVERLDRAPKSVIAHRILDIVAASKGLAS